MFIYVWSVIGAPINPDKILYCNTYFYAYGTKIRIIKIIIKIYLYLLDKYLRNICEWNCFDTK